MQSFPFAIDRQRWPVARLQHLHSYAGTTGFTLLHAHDWIQQSQRIALRLEPVCGRIFSRRTRVFRAQLRLGFVRPPVSAQLQWLRAFPDSGLPIILVLGGVAQLGANWQRSAASLRYQQSGARQFFLEDSTSTTSSSGPISIAPAVFTYFSIYNISAGRLSFEWFDHWHLDR